MEMKRKLTDTLKNQIDSGLIFVSEETLIQGSLRFRTMPNRGDIGRIEQQALTYLFQFQELSRKFKLPTHNAVAFFTTALKLEPLLKSSDRHDFMLLLALALSGQGFVFGTTFDLEQRSDIRACDITQESSYDIRVKFEVMPELFSVHEKDWEKRAPHALYIHSLENHASLMGNLNFIRDFRECKDLCDKLLTQRQLVTEWRKSVGDSSAESVPVTLNLYDILEFWRIYEEYCISQLKYSPDYISNWIPDEQKKVAVASVEEARAVEMQLKDLKQTLILLVRLDLLCCEIKNILKIDDKARHLEAKRRWIQKFRRFITGDETARVIAVAEEIALTPDGAPECFLGLKNIMPSICSGSLAQDVKKKYPMIDDKIISRNLNQDESNVVEGYQKHPMYKCFQMVITELSKRNMAVIAPYYLLHWFIHKRAPRKPFAKKAYKLTHENTPLNCRLTDKDDERLHYTQECNAQFFSHLCEWYSNVTQRHPAMTPYRKDLCDALYVRCRPLIVKKDWLLVESRPQYKKWMPDDIVYQIYQKLNGLFDYGHGHFPIYAITEFRPEEMLYYFYEKQESKIIKIKRQISRLIDDQTVAEYKKLAFLIEPGIGNSYKPRQWHWNLAEWLESIIKRDPVVEEYVVGDPDPYYPTTKMKLTTLNSRVTWLKGVKSFPMNSPDVLKDITVFLNNITDADIKKDDEAIYPEDAQPNLSVVEWYIQKKCCEKIGDAMRPEIFDLYKRVFLGP